MEHEIEPIADKDPAFLLQELEHWNSQREKALAMLQYTERKIGELTTLMSSTNVVYVEDARWRNE